MPPSHQCTKHKTTRETQHRSGIRMDVPPPHQCTAPEQGQQEKFETQDKIRTRMDVHPSTPHPCTELKYKWKSKLACAKNRESTKTPKHRCEMRYMQKTPKNDAKALKPETPFEGCSNKTLEGSCKRQNKRAGKLSFFTLSSFAAFGS